MKVVVYNPKEPKDPVVRLALEDAGGEDGVSLIAMDENGIPVPGGRILRITSAGIVRRYSYINQKLGLQLDYEDRIVVK